MTARILGNALALSFAQKLVGLAPYARHSESGRPKVHHIRTRSRLGDDMDEKLITLCADCYSNIRQNRFEMSSL